MKLEINCDHYKPTNKNGIKDKCNCKYLNRNFKRELKLWAKFMNALDTKKK